MSDANYRNGMSNVGYGSKGPFLVALSSGAEIGIDWVSIGWCWFGGFPSSPPVSRFGAGGGWVKFWETIENWCIFFRPRCSRE